MAITADRLPPIARRLIPSLADLLFAALLVSQIQPSLFSDADTGWHLWAGRAVLAHGPGPIGDALTWTRAGAPWSGTQWLGEAALALAHARGGWIGLALLCSLVFAGTFTWLYRVLFAACRHAPAAMTVTLLAALMAWPHLLARPALFSFPLFLATLRVARARSPGLRQSLIIVALTVLWANVHPSAVLAPFVVALAWLERGRDRRLLYALVLAALALCATPQGAGWLAGLLPHGRNLVFFRGIDEWRTPQFREPRYWALMVFLLLAPLVRLRGGPLRPGEALGGAIWLAAALLAARLAPFGALWWAERLARDLAGRGDPGVTPARLPAAVVAEIHRVTLPFESALRPGLWPVAIVLAALLAGPRLAAWFPETARGFPAEEFPAGALDAADRLHLGPRAFTGYEWGGWLPCVSQGRYRVFIDGRAGFFSGPVLDDYLALVRLAPGWPRTLARRAPDWLLVRNDLPLATAAPLTGAWRVAWSDTLAAILVPVP